MTDLIAHIARQDTESTITLRRIVRTDPADLWDAIVTPERAARWLGDLSGDLAEGGEYHVVFDANDPTGRVDGTVRTCVPEQELEVTWQAPGDTESLVHVRLVPGEGETTLELTHSRLAVGSSDTGHAAGWQVHLDQLAAGIERDDWSDQWGRWTELEQAYRASVTK